MLATGCLFHPWRCAKAARPNEGFARLPNNPFTQMRWCWPVKAPYCDVRTMTPAAQGLQGQMIECWCGINGPDFEAASQCASRSSLLCPSAGQLSGRQGLHTSSGVAGWLELMYDHRVSTWHTGCAQMVAAVAYPLVVWQLVCGPESTEQRYRCWIKCFLSAEQRLGTLWHCSQVGL